MKKYLLLTFFLSIFFGFSNVSFAARYGNFDQTISGLKSRCNQDSDPSAITQQQFWDPLASSWYTWDSKVISISGNTIYCQRRDDKLPTGSLNYSETNWTKNDVTVTITCSDTGGSGCNMLEISGWTRNIPLNQYSKIFSANTSGIESITLYDIAGNSQMVYYEIANIDKIAPSAGNISGTGVTKDGSYIIAKTSEDFSISVSNAGGSPITNIQGRFEQHNNISGWNTYNSPNSNLVVNSNISNVDLQRTNGYRTYTFEITSITDQAGNTVINPVTYNYYVYAGNINSGKSLLDGTIYNLNNIANGTPYTLSGSLRDMWDNMIVPVLGIRNVAFKINYSNELYLNQYSNTLPRPTSVYAYSGATDLLLSSGINLTKLLPNDLDGTYNVDFKVYSPTEIAYNKAKGYFTIIDIKASVSDIGTDITLNNSNILFYFKPIYQTTINSPVTTDGFMIQATQTGTIDIIRNGAINPNATLSLEFGSGGTSSASPLYSPKFNMKLTSPGILDISGTNDYEGYSKRRDYNSFNSNKTYYLNTYLTQSGVVNNTAGQYLSSHIGYTIAGPSGNLDVLYNGDILGKTNYWSSPILGLSNTNQGLKIGGISSSQNQTDITTEQGQNDLHIIGNVSKTILKKDMRKNVYNLINQLNITNGSYEITDLDGDVTNNNIWNNGAGNGKTTLSGTVLYFNGVNVELDSTEKVRGKKTIIVVGGNLYIKKNVVNNTSSDILGIIVLKDDNGDYGNLYIDPDVTRIDAVIYTDKSLISYSGGELDGETPQAVLANQLYINGSVFSENTIGGSIKTPPVCPYYVDSLTCDQKTAQKYDLNFLRRYYYVSGPTAINGGKNYFGKYTLAEYPNYLYPVVIKYNPQIQSYPPPLFGN